MVWTVRIFWSITISMVHPVQYSIGPWRQIGTALAKPGEEIKEFFPIFIHGEHLMGSISVEKETLAKQREIPMKEEEDN